MFLLFDIGGTKTRLAFSPDGETFEDPVKSATPEDFEKGIALIKRRAKELAAGRPIRAAAGGIAGPLNAEKSALVNSPNLPGWVGKPLRQELKRALAVPVALENDTAVVGLGEAHFGAGAGSDIVVYITVSTGVGGVRIVRGAVDVNRYGFEPGHQIIDLDGTACTKCNGKGAHEDGSGHLEGYVSGTALELRMGRAPKEIPQSDPVWEELARYLAVGLNNTIVHWSPDVVVLGGSMIVGDPEIPLSSIERYLAEELKLFPQLPALKKAELKDIGGLYGGLVLARTLERTS